MRQPNRRPWAVPICLVAIVLIAAAAPAPAAPSRVQTLSPSLPDVVPLRDGVIVDRTGGVAYLMNPEGRVDALRTTDGTVLWSSPEAAKPLLVMGDLLIAQAEPSAPGELPVVTLDRGAGKLLASASIDLPRDLWASLSDRPGTSFRVAAAPLDGRVALSWEAKRAAAGPALQGYVPAPSEGQAPDAAAAVLAERSRVERLGGSALLDPLSGAVTVREKAAVARVAAPTLATFDGLAEIAGRKFLSADGRHVLVSRRTDSRQVVERYRWAIYTRGGELLGKMASDRSAAPFVVVGSQALVEARPYVVRRGETTVGEPLRIRSVDLSNGLEVWSEPIRQVEFAGPFPP